MKMWTRNVLLGCQIGNSSNQDSAGLQELYQLLPTKLYDSRKTKTHTDGDEKCRKAP